MPSSVSLYCEEGEKIPRGDELLKLAKRLVKEEKLKGNVNVIFCPDQKVRTLNREYRGLDKVTDVLSFGWEEPGFAGEVFIANLQAKRQSKRFNNTYFNELRRLVVHGLLHICGYDHMKARDRLIMREKEDYYLNL